MTECVVCFEPDRDLEVLDTIFNACAHSNVCSRCASCLPARRCPTCRRPIDPAIKPPVGVSSLVRNLTPACESEAVKYAEMFGFPLSDLSQGDCPFVLRVLPKDIDLEGVASKISYVGLRAVVTDRMMEDVLRLVEDEFKTTTVLGAHGAKAWYWSGVPSLMYATHNPMSPAERRLDNLRDALNAAEDFKKFIVPCKPVLNDAADAIVYEPTIDHPDFLYVDGCAPDHSSVSQYAHKMTDPAVERGEDFFELIDSCMSAMTHQLSFSRFLHEVSEAHPVFGGVDVLDSETVQNKLLHLETVRKITRAWVDGEFRFCAWNAETESWQPCAYSRESRAMYMSRAVMGTVLQILTDGPDAFEQEHGALKLVHDSLRHHYQCLRIDEDKERLVDLKTLLNVTKWPFWVSPYDSFTKSAVCMALAIQRAHKHAMARGGLLREPVPMDPEIPLCPPVIVNRHAKRSAGEADEANTKKLKEPQEAS